MRFLLAGMLLSSLAFAELSDTATAPETCGDSVIKTIKEKGKLEKELKYQLTKEAFAVTVQKAEALPYHDRAFETFYFDTEDFELKERDINLRLRLEGPGAEITLKLPADKSQSRPVEGEIKAKQRWEWEEAMDRSSAWQLSSGNSSLRDVSHPILTTLSVHLDRSLLQRVFPVGSVRTVRRVVTMDDNTLEIDHCYFLGREIFEIEVETATPEITHSKMLQVLQAWGVEAKLSKKSKRQRLIEAIKASRQS